METEIALWLDNDSALVVSATIFILLVLGGLGFPIPEDIPLIFGGVAISKGLVGVNIMFIICYLGVLIGDLTMFFIGHRYGVKLLNKGTKSRFFPMITEERVQEVREGLRKRRLLYIFIGRHLFPLRSVTFVTAGALHIPFLEFFIADALAALVSVMLMLTLGYWLGETLTPERLSHITHEANFYIFLAIVLIVAGYFTRRWWGKKQAKKFTHSAYIEEESLSNAEKQLRH